MIFNKSNIITPLFILNVLVVFLLTMSFEIVGNIFLILFLLVYKDKLVLDKKYLFLSLLYSALLIPFYINSSNSFLLRFIIYIPRFLLIVYGLKSYISTWKKIDLENTLSIVYVIHCFVILACAIYPPLNDFLNIILGKRFTSEFRISGLFTGYDFISFFTIVYLYVDFRLSDFTFNAERTFKLILGFSATIVTGRFGLISYLIFLGFIFFRRITFSKILIFGIGIILGFKIFYTRILLFFSTFLLLRDAIQLEDPYNSKISIEDYGAESQDGIYDLSPLVLLEESTRPFYKIGTYFFPNLIGDEVDSGPSFVILNIGFFLSILVYILYFKVILKDVKSSFLLFLFILLMDFKFRTILVLMPTSWIVLNTYKLNNCIQK